MSRSKYSLPTNECKLKFTFFFLFTLLSVNVITERLRRYNKARARRWKSSTFQRCGWSKLFVLKLWSLTAAFIVQYTLMSDSEGNSFVSRASWFKCTCLLHLTGCFRLFRFTVVTLVWQQIFYCFCYVQTLAKSIIFLLLEINLKFPAAGVHQPFIPMTDKIFLKQLPKHTNRGSQRCAREYHRDRRTC